MAEENWEDFVHRLVVDYCNQRGSRTFTLQEFQQANETIILNFTDSNKDPFAKVRQKLQVLRKNGILSFVDNRGTYTLRKPEILEGELPSEFSEEAAPFLYGESDISRPRPIKNVEKKEYVREIFARDRGWVTEAKRKFGCNCLLPNCSNTFLTQTGKPYIEVHHIVPLHEGGEDAIWNLAVVCAHHHKMAHFADDKTQKSLEKTLLSIVDKRLSA